MAYIDDMKLQTIGVEVEMNNITRKEAARVAAEFFGTGRYDYTAYTDGYQTWSAWDATGRKWKFQKDVSISGPDDQKCEMVTPILVYDDIEMLQELVRVLRRAGAKSDARRGCGVHIHIGADGHTAKSLRFLINLMKVHEDQISEMIGISESRKYHYCQPVDVRLFERVNAEKPSTMAGLADVWYESQNCDYDRNHHYNDSRYHMLNLHATFTKGTVEFRCFEFEAPKDGKQNGLHAGQLKAWIVFCLAMNHASKNCGYVPYRHVHEVSKEVFTNFLYGLGLKGDEFKNVRENLTRKLRRRAELAA